MTVQSRLRIGAANTALTPIRLEDAAAVVADGISQKVRFSRHTQPKTCWLGRQLLSAATRWAVRVACGCHSPWFRSRTRPESRPTNCTTAWAARSKKSEELVALWSTSMAERSQRTTAWVFICSPVGCASGNNDDLGT